MNKIVHYSFDLQPYRAAERAPCGAVLTSGDPGAVQPGTTQLHKVTCSDCRRAIRVIALAVDRARRAKTIDKYWGDE